VQALSQQARETGDAVKDALQSAGLEVAANYGKEDMGGPLIEVNNPSKFDRRIKELDHALDRQRGRGLDGDRDLRELEPRRVRARAARRVAHLPRGCRASSSSAEVNGQTSTTM